VEAVLRALADESRRTMLDTLTGGPATAGELAALLPVARPGGGRRLRGRRGWAGSARTHNGARAVFAPRRSARAMNGWAGTGSCWSSGSTPCTPRWPGGNANEGAPDDQQRRRG